MRYLTSKDLEVLSTTTAERILHTLDAGHPESAKTLCDEFQAEYVLLHDVYLDWAAGLLSYVGETHTQEDLKEATTWSVGQYLRPLYDVDTTAADKDECGRKDGATDTFVATKLSSDRDKLVNWTGIWHAHFSSFQEIEERDDCFLLYQDACGSGGRLLRSGAYEAPKSYHIVPHMDFSARKERNFPVYCYHCFAGIEGNLELTGKSVFGIDTPPREKDDVCVFRIPKESPSGERLFDHVELAHLSRPKMARAGEAIDHGETARARELVQTWANDCLANHDIYRNWIAALLTFIYDRWGYGELVQALRRSVRSWIFHPLSEPGLKTVYEHLMCGDPVSRAWNLARLLKSDGGSFTAEEDDEKFTFIYHCGSGGRLIKEGAYEKRGWARLRETTGLTRGNKNYPVYCAACKAVTDTLATGSTGLSIVVDHGSDTPGSPCKLSLYKDPDTVPREFTNLLTPELV